MAILGWMGQQELARLEEQEAPGLEEVIMVPEMLERLGAEEVLFPAMLLLLFTPQLYRHFPEMFLRRNIVGTVCPQIWNTCTH